MDTDFASDPLLPPEIERMIFEIAFDIQSPQDNWKLVSVAKRVRTWLRPLIYSTFIQFVNAKAFPNMKTYPGFIDLKEICQFALNHLVDLSNLTTHDAVSDLLEKCPNLTNLACWGHIDAHHLWPSLSKLSKLRRLSAKVEHISSTQFLSATFSSRLTHLEMLEPTNDWKFESLISLTSLTHLAIFYPSFTLDYKRLGTILQACHGIHVFVLTTQHGDLGEAGKDLYVADCRMVVLDDSLSEMKHWIYDVNGHNDSWEYAEQVVLMRRVRWIQLDILCHRNITAFQYVKTILGTPWDDYLTEEGMKWIQNSILSELGPLSD
ncbi:hypothetical protein CVT24_010594 [Panaeolus cyanescens]|uniref:F-box domain-containing protein n=1 Tax=Panaeolus cyanescens TaxID=181874 RepID=A0A409WAY0_9AGAR|nr:hypothetical protein CVT24_010594 [Panaeolus cyanescens]